MRVLRSLCFVKCDCQDSQRAFRRSATSAPVAWSRFAATALAGRPLLTRRSRATRCDTCGPSTGPESWSNGERRQMRRQTMRQTMCQTRRQTMRANEPQLLLVQQRRLHARKARLGRQVAKHHRQRLRLVIRSGRDGCVGRRDDGQHARAPSPSNKAGRDEFAKELEQRLLRDDAAPREVGRVRARARACASGRTPSFLPFGRFSVCVAIKENDGQTPRKGNEQRATHGTW